MTERKILYKVNLTLPFSKGWTNQAFCRNPFGLHMYCCLISLYINFMFKVIYEYYTLAKCNLLTDILFLRFIEKAPTASLPNIPDLGF